MVDGFLGEKQAPNGIYLLDRLPTEGGLLVRPILDAWHMSDDITLEQHDANVCALAWLRAGLNFFRVGRTSLWA